MQATLLILAAGMGSRYGGLKQLDPMGPNGETLLDFSVRDALAAGFEKVCFVIRRDFEEAFTESVLERYRDKVECAIAHQELDDLPPGFSPPEQRSRPWGTAHAVWAAREQVTGPFVVANADDYYGADAYQRIIGYLEYCQPDIPDRLALVAYPISNTLSPHGTVNRGVCRLQEDGRLLASVEEHTAIAADEGGRILGLNPAGARVEISPTALVSMNFWAFAPAVFAELENFLAAFFAQNLDCPKAECYIPAFVDAYIRAGASCEVCRTSGQWFGVTYPEDKENVRISLMQRFDQGRGPANWCG